VIRTNINGWGTNYRQSFSDFIIRALRANVHLSLFQDLFYTPILAETLAMAVHDLIDLKASGVFNVVGDERISKYEFGKKIANEFALEVSGVEAGLFSDQKTMVSRPLDMSLSNQKVCNLLGRQLGDVKRHIAKLHQQELNGFTEKMHAL
jgi:dTDP-4-dehydrorhamnose reductase